MKLVELKCKNCGATLKVDPESEEITCKYCQTTFKLDDEVKHVKFDNMEQNGYEFEKGRIRAQQESKNYSTSVSYSQPQKKNNRTLWLILAWIFLLPFTATYFIAKSDKLDKKKKIIIIAIMWIVFLIIGWTSSSQEAQDKKDRIIKCYSEEVYNKLDELIGMDNIKGNFDSSYTCEKLELKDKNYKKITINIDKDNNEYTIIVGDETIYKGSVEKEKESSKEKTSAIYNKFIELGFSEDESHNAEQILKEAKIKSFDSDLKTFDPTSDDKADIVKIKSNQYDKAYSFRYNDCSIKMYLKDNKVIYLSSSNHMLIFYDENNAFIDEISKCYTN